MQYLVIELMFNTKYLSVSDMLSLRSLNTYACKAYKMSNIKRHVSIYILKRVIDKSGINDSDFLKNISSNELIDIFNIISQQYYDNIFGDEAKFSFLDYIIDDKLYPFSWYKSKHKSKVKKVSVILLNKNIKASRNLDAILNYPDPPRNKRYSLY